MPVRSVWNGDEVISRVRSAVRESINEAADEAADDARGSHWWKNRTGQLEEEIISEHAREGGNLIARFGTTVRRGFYGLFHEYTTPFIRPAADRHFRRDSLDAKVRRRLR